MSDLRYGVARSHYVAHMRQQFAPKRTAGVRSSEFVAAESFRLHDRNGERVAERKRGGDIAVGARFSGHASFSAPTYK